MPDLNHILLFVAVASPAVLLVQMWRGAASPSWRGAAIAVLAVTGAAWLLARPVAGVIGSAAWLLLLFLPATGTRRSLELAQRGEFAKARRWLTLLRFVHAGGAVREHAHVIDAMEAAHAEGRRFPSVSPPSMFGRTRAKLTPVVATLMLLSASMFAMQIWLGGSTNWLTLHRLGALEPAAVLSNGEYWRFVSALFLHYGAAHLLVNLFALYFFGPTLESALGSFRFVACYLISGVGSCAQITFFWRMGWLDIDQLVGASAAVMGIVGAWAGSLIRDRHLPHNRRTLRNIVIIVTVQTVFDLVTPRVSMAAHLTGLTTGFMLGLLMTRRTADPTHRGTTTS